jgi:6-phosphofructokinase 1
MVVAQSGGPSPVINNSLRGLVETARELSEIGAIYAGWHGIEGVLKEELLDLSAQEPAEIALLGTTPAAGSIGTCRYKLRDHQTEDLDRLIDVFRAHDIGYFCYIGGNDSMDTADKVAKLAQDRGLELVGFGVPKTIDNDVGDSEFRLIDHTPGYGSTARYWAQLVQFANEENRGSSPADPVLVLQAMGRRIGFIPAAARLADPERQMPLQIYLAEREVTIDQMADNVNDALRRDGRVIVVVSEGLTLGEIGESHDAFGHAQFSSSRTTVAQLVINQLNERGLPVKGSARANVPGTDQRHNMVSASVVDLDEAYQAGRQAALLAAAGESGYMSTILREEGPGYRVRYDKVPLSDVANSERAFPAGWISADGTDVTDEFVRYARPLIGDEWVRIPLVDGLVRLARLRSEFADQKLPKYVPQADRT